MIRSLLSATALCLCATSASAAALTMPECRAKYKAEILEREISHSWAEYQVKQCGLPAQTTRKPKSSR